MSQAEDAVERTAGKPLAAIVASERDPSKWLSWATGFYAPYRRPSHSRINPVTFAG